MSYRILIEVKKLALLKCRLFMTLSELNEDDKRQGELLSEGETNEPFKDDR